MCVSTTRTISLCLSGWRAGRHGFWVRHLYVGHTGHAHLALPTPLPVQHLCGLAALPGQQLPDLQSAVQSFAADQSDEEEAATLGSSATSSSGVWNALYSSTRAPVFDAWHFYFCQEGGGCHGAEPLWKWGGVCGSPSFWSWFGPDQRRFTQVREFVCGASWRDNRIFLTTEWCGGERHQPGGRARGVRSRVADRGAEWTCDHTHSAEHPATACRSEELQISVEKNVCFKSFCAS